MSYKVIFGTSSSDYDTWRYSEGNTYGTKRFLSYNGNEDFRSKKDAQIAIMNDILLDQSVCSQGEEQPKSYEVYSPERDAYAFRRQNKLCGLDRFTYYFIW